MNNQLQQIYEQDIFDRTNGTSSEQIDLNDQKRLKLVGEILQSDSNLDASDYHHAALIFQHGEELSHYQKAHELAKKAVEMGDESAKWLAAASLDRSLLMQGKAQKYGTQFIKNNEGTWELALPIDPLTTDEERQAWNVPPFSEALEVFTKKLEQK